MIKQLGAEELETILQATQSIEARSKNSETARFCFLSLKNEPFRKTKCGQARLGRDKTHSKQQGTRHERINKEQQRSSRSATYGNEYHHQYAIFQPSLWCCTVVLYPTGCDSDAVVPSLDSRSHMRHGLQAARALSVDGTERHGVRDTRANLSNAA